MPKRDLVVTLVGVNKTDRAFNKAMQNTEKMGQNLLGFGAIAGAGFGAAVMASAKFDQAMSGVRAVSGATAEEMDRLSDAALKAGADTVFSASDAARAEAELTKAGVGVSDVLGGALTGSLDLAAAGQLDLAESATIAAQAMNIFDLAGSDVAHVADVLAAGANKSAADVQQLGDAMRQGGLLAKQTGLDLEDTVGILAAFADNALVGSDAGTSLKTMLQRLTPQSEKAAGEMDKLGIRAYNAQGNFVGLGEYAEILKRQLSGLTQEQRNSTLATVFGSDAVRAANILYELGADGVKEYTDAVDDQGAAARMAQTQMDNLAGDVEALKGSIETALIQSGSSANGVLRFMAQNATDAVNAFSSAPGPVQAAATAIAGVAGATSLAAGAALVLIPRIHATNEALSQMGPAGAKAKGALAVFGRAGAITAGIAATAGALNILGDAVDDALGRGPANLSTLATNIKTFAAEAEVGGELARLFGDDLKGFGAAADKAFGGGTTRKIARAGDEIAGFFGATSSMEKAERDIKAVDEALAQLASGGQTQVAATMFDRLSAGAEAFGIDAETLRQRMPAYATALEDLAANEKLAADEAEKAGPAIAGMGDAAEGAVPQVEELTEAQENLRDSLSEFIDPMGAYEQILKDKEDAERKTAQATADATESQADSWEDFAKEVDVSIDEVIDALKKQAESQGAWYRNMTTLAGKVSQETLDHLSRLGPEGAPLVQELVTSSDAKIKEFDRLLSQGAGTAVNNAATAIEANTPAFKSKMAALTGPHKVDVNIKPAMDHLTDLLTFGRYVGRELNPALHTPGFIGPTIAEGLAQQGVQGPYTPTQTGVNPAPTRQTPTRNIPMSTGGVTYNFNTTVNGTNLTAGDVSRELAWQAQTAGV